MNQLQKQLILKLLKDYPNLKIYCHRDLKATACPGKNFPSDFFKNLRYSDDKANLKFYTVKRGDTLTKIAKQYGTTVENVATLRQTAGATLTKTEKSYIKNIKDSSDKMLHAAEMYEKASVFPGWPYRCFSL